MNSFLNSLSMGGYAGFVWSAYGTVISVLILNIFTYCIQKKRTKKSLIAWYKRITS